MSAIATCPSVRSGAGRAPELIDFGAF